MGKGTQHKLNSTVAIPALLVSLIGGLGVLGWVSGIEALTRISPEWNPTAPLTAASFFLCGMSLLAGWASDRTPLRFIQIISTGLVGVVSVAQILEIGLNRTLGVETIDMGWLMPSGTLGQISLPAALCFAVFVAGTEFSRHSDRRLYRVLASLAAAVLLTIGLAVLIGHWLKLSYLFDDFYSATGLIWLSFPTGIGMTMLGAALIGLIQAASRSATYNADKQAWEIPLQIHRNITAFVIVAFVGTSMLGLKFLENAIERQAILDMQQTIAAQSAFIELNFDYRIQRARLASDDLARTLDSALLAAQPSNAEALSSARAAVERYLSHGFTSIAFETPDRLTVLAGNPLSENVFGVRIDSEGRKGESSSLIWSGAYYLRVKTRLSATSTSAPSAYLVTEQNLPRLDAFFKQAHEWGETGTSPLCSRRSAGELACFPQRERGMPFTVPDHYNGRPLPATRALSGASGVALTTDYRGRDVLAAYRPVGNTGLGLVLRMDASEVYAPIKRQLLLSLPFLTLLTTATFWLIRLRVRPLINELARAHDAEKAEHARFVAAMESSPDVFVIYESVNNVTGEIADFRIAYLNRPARAVDNPSGAQKGQALPGILPGDGGTFEKYKKVLHTGQTLEEEVSIGEGIGERKWYRRKAIAMPEGIAVTISDITREKNLLRQVEESNLLRTAILESSAYAIISTDPQGIITSFNKAAERLLWYNANELVNKATPEVFHDIEEIKRRADELSNELGTPVAPGFGVFIAKANRDYVEEREWTYVRKDGSRLPVLLSVTALRDADDRLRGYLGVAHDISSQKRADEYIRHIALHDVLTGLPNRALLEDRIKSAIENQRRNEIPFALIMMDIDRFKHVNDSMGHHIGDSLLKQFVVRVGACLRPTDTLARMGGDEFVLILSECEDDGALVVSERIMEVLSSPIDIGLQDLHITSSMGISICPRDGMDANELLRRADVALYWVKEHGRNGYKFFHSGMDQGATERLQLERALHRALEHNDFVVFYQPQIDLKSNAVIGVEALLRWEQSDGLLVSPATFIPLAEDTGLIIPIGTWVLNTACGDMARIGRHTGLNTKVAVNISPRQFMNGDLTHLVRTALNKSGLDASLLELEVTEGVLMDDRIAVAATFDELNSLGIAIAIDDFGTGYSSLSYLKRFPISKIKIDQSFVRHVTTATEDAALTSAIIAMGHSLRIPVIAEGIETAEQLAYLAANDCDEGQGYHLGRPMPVDALLEWLSDYRSRHPAIPPLA